MNNGHYKVHGACYQAPPPISFNLAPCVSHRVATWAERWIGYRIRPSCHKLGGRDQCDEITGPGSDSLTTCERQFLVVKRERAWFRLLGRDHSELQQPGPLRWVWVQSQRPALGMEVTPNVKSMAIRPVDLATPLGYYAYPPYVGGNVGVRL